MYTIWEIETQNLWFTRMPSQGEVGGQRCLLVLAFMCFLWNNLWSVSRYIMGPFSGWWRQGGNGQHYLAAHIWKYRSGIGDHRFKFFMDLLPNYTLFTNLSILFIGYLLIEDVTLNLWKVKKIMQHRLMPVWDDILTPMIFWPPLRYFDLPIIINDKVLFAFYIYLIEYVI